MLDEQDRDRLFQELKEKLELVEQRVEELEEIPAEEQSDERDLIFGSVDFKLPFRVHWVTVSETDYALCSDIDTVVKAQNALLKFAADSRKSSERYVKHGDVLVLLCNHAEKTPIDPSDENSELEFKDACYYVGMCVSSRQPGQRVPTMEGDIQLGGALPEDDSLRILVWDTCGVTDEPCEESPKIIETLSNLDFEIESSGDDCKVFTLTLSADVKKLTFECGILVSEEDLSPISIEETIEAKGCDDTGGCANSYTVNGPSVSNFVIDCTDTTVSNVHPDCCQEYEKTVHVPYGGSTPLTDCNIQNFFGQTTYANLINNGHGLATLIVQYSSRDPKPDGQGCEYTNYSSVSYTAERVVDIGTGASLSGDYEITSSASNSNLVGQIVTVN